MPKNHIRVVCEDIDGVAGLRHTESDSLTGSGQAPGGCQAGSWYHDLARWCALA